MAFICFCLVFAQTTNSVIVPKGIVEHDGIERLLSALPRDIFDQQDRIRELVAERDYAEVKLALAKAYQQTEKHRAVQLVALSWLVSDVASTRFKQPTTKEAVDGRTDPAFRTLCRPYVDAIVLPDVSIPASPELLDAQIRAVIVFQANTDESDRDRTKDRAELRREYVRRLCLVWERLIRSCLAYRDSITEDIVKGRERLRRPEKPAFLISYANGRTDPKLIKDPVQRKEYEDYLAADRIVVAQHRAAVQTSYRRSQHLITIRRSLESIYGEDRSKWDELRQLVKDTITEPEIAELVIKDFTRRKDPGVWP